MNLWLCGRLDAFARTVGAAHRGRPRLNTRFKNPGSRVWRTRSNRGRPRRAAPTERSTNHYINQAAWDDDHLQYLVTIDLGPHALICECSSAKVLFRDVWRCNYARTQLPVHLNRNLQ